MKSLCLSFSCCMLIMFRPLIPVTSFVTHHGRRTTTFANTRRSPRVAVQQLHSSFAKKPSQQQKQFTTKINTPKTNKQNQNMIQIPTWVPDHDAGALDETGYERPVIQWYPGHIAKAERVLKETFQAVDVVVEVRDARAPKATSHPKVPEWCSGRPRLIVLTHTDMVPTASQRAWKQFHVNENSQDELQFLWVNAKQGQGIPALHRAIFKAGAHVQERRQRRGLKDRPLRVGLMGFPNVGKSALINRLLGRRRARTANIPGVTRSLQWIRIRTDDQKKTGKKEYELLDSPGIIPASLDNQSDALLLAACHCIGEASYDNQVVASYLCQWMQNLLIHHDDKIDVAAPDWRTNCKSRWGFDPLEPVPLEDPFGTASSSNDDDDEEMLRYITGEEMLYKVADNTCKGSPEDASRKILQDFRSGRMGPVCLQLAPDNIVDDSMVNDFSQVPDPRMGSMRTEGMMPTGHGHDWEQVRAQKQAEQLQRAKAARETAKERGLELPPSLVVDHDTPKTTNNSKDGDNKNKNNNKLEMPDDVGKGLFDGW